MITCERARNLVRKNCVPSKIETKAIPDSLGYVLAEDIRSPFALPLYDNAAMDGFVLRSKDALSASPGKPVAFRIRGTVKAGATSKKVLHLNETYRIMTGAVIPVEGDTVLQKEYAVVKAGHLLIGQPLPTKHIRYQGEELKKGQKVIFKKSIIHPGVIGVLASLGKNKVKVYKKPSVCVVATGSELVQPGKRIRPGEIYDSNSWMIRAALEEAGIPVIFTKTLKDRPGLIKEAISLALRKSDVLILVGGISVGDYDFVKSVFKELRVRKIFWRVKQKPGKPLYFGRRGKKIIFGLPGNPAAAFTCFYEYVYPVLRLGMGCSESGAFLWSERKTLGSNVIPDKKRALFLKARVNHHNVDLGATVEVSGRQGSHMISAFSEGNALAFIPAGGRTLHKGQKVSVHHLPWK